MKRLRLIREALDYPLDYVAERVQRPVLTIKGWEAGTAAPTIADLRELAMLYGTGVDDLTGAVALESQPVRTCRMTDGEGIDSFWGHLGVMLPHGRSYRWVPITTSAAREIDAKIGRRAGSGSHTQSLVVETLNNRLLWISLLSIKSVGLCDEATEWPEPCADADKEPAGGLAEIEAHPNHLIPQVMYEVIAERSRGRERTDDVPMRLKQEIDELLETRREAVSDEHLKRLLLSVRLWMADGSVLWVAASRESMRASLADLLPAGPGGLLRFSGEDDSGLRFVFPLSQIAMIDFPASSFSSHEALS